MNNEEINMLIKQFKIIAEKRYIKSAGGGHGAIGLTFEKELKKKYDDTYFPDYYGTEIKCTGRFSHYPISLFSAAFDGPTFPEINRILDKYGSYDKKYKDKKVIFANLNAVEPKSLNDKFSFKLDIDDDKIYLCVYDPDLTLIERKSYIYIDKLYNHFNLKLNKLAIIYASIKRKPENTCFRYYKIEIYKLINESIFIEALQKGFIKAQLIVRATKNGYGIGRTKSKNLLFTLDKKYINKVFSKIYSYDYDRDIEIIK